MPWPTPAAASAGGWSGWGGAKLTRGRACWGLPADARSFAMIPVGWPLGKFGPVRRRPVDEALAWNRWA